jgi:hypothetical protein
VTGSADMSSQPQVRDDFVDAETIAGFVGEVEPGDHVPLAVVLWCVGLSLALIIGASIWWSATH